jgi:hypothetical protein
MRGRDGRCNVGTVSAEPGLPEPGRCVQRRGGGLGEEGGALAIDAAEHGVRQALIAGLAAATGDQRHGGIDRGMGGGAEKQQLGNAETEQLADASGAVRQRLLEAAAKDMIDLPEPAQHRRRQQPCEAAIARLERA